MEEKDEDSGEYVYTAQWLLNKCREENLGDALFWKQKLIAFVNCFNDIARRITNKNKSSKQQDMLKTETYLSDATHDMQHIDGTLLGHDLPTAPIKMITASNNRKGIQPSDVPLILCINYKGDEIPPIHAILRHLVSVNELLLLRCRGHTTQNIQLQDTISLRNISQRKDCVDIEESEFIGILQNYTQQSLKYGASTLSMNF
eukprot:182267_1